MPQFATACYMPAPRLFTFLLQCLAADYRCLHTGSCFAFRVKISGIDAAYRMAFWLLRWTLQLFFSLAGTDAVEATDANIVVGRFSFSGDYRYRHILFARQHAMIPSLSPRRTDAILYDFDKDYIEFPD